jgi:hypothetical protein
MITKFKIFESNLNDNFYNWFGKSKVVDDNGNPLITYHGTDNEFKEFQYRMIGTHGTGEGKGFYFTDQEDVAKGYVNKEGGKLIQAYLKIEKPLNYTKKTITKPQLAKFINKLDKDGTGNFLSNIGDVNHEGYNNLLRKAVNDEFEYNDTDVDMIHDILNVFGDYQEGYKVLYETLGYDGIIVDRPEWKKEQKIYVVFFPNHIKSVDNVGTFNINNNNIFENKD